MNGVLWVEDSEDQRFLLETASLFLEEVGGYDVATSVQDAISKAGDRARAGERYTLVACDLQLPGGTGWDVLTALVADGHPADEFAIVSASSDPRDTMRAQDLGCRFVVKPSDLSGWTSLAEWFATVGNAG